MELLLDAGAAPEAAALDGATPLLLAAEGGHMHCVQVRGRDAVAWRCPALPVLPGCLHAGAQHRSPTLLCPQSLLRRGADVNAPDAAGTTPLLAALAAGHGRTAEVLLAAGAKTGGRLGERVGGAGRHGGSGRLALSAPAPADLCF